MHSFSRPHAVLFDLDGTLVDSAPDFDAVVNSLRAEQQRPPLPFSRIREQVSNGGFALACITFEVERTHPQIMQFRQQVLDRYLEYIGQHSQLFDGFQAVLEQLTHHHIQWGIVTNKPRLYAEILLDRLNIQTPILVCPEDVTHKKPHPEPLFQAAQALHLNASDCWYVGDHERDIEAAIAAHMPSVAALFGYIEPQVNPHDWHADFYINTPQDLLPLLSL